MWGLARKNSVCEETIYWCCRPAERIKRNSVMGLFQNEPSKRQVGNTRQRKQEWGNLESNSSHLCWWNKRWEEQVAVGTLLTMIRRIMVWGHPKQIVWETLSETMSWKYPPQKKVPAEWSSGRAPAEQVWTPEFKPITAKKKKKKKVLELMYFMVLKYRSLKL
jgi:hypothetical protein